MNNKSLRLNKSWAFLWALFGDDGDGFGAVRGIVRQY